MTSDVSAIQGARASAAIDLISSSDIDLIIPEYSGFKPKVLIPKGNSQNPGHILILQWITWIIVIPFYS